MTPRPALSEILSGLRVVRLPLRVRFRGLDVRETALFPGPAGWAEFGPFVEYPPVEAARWLAAAIEAAYAGWPSPVRATVPVNATVPAVPAARVADVLARFAGASTAKVKVAEPGGSLAEDLDRVAAVRAVLGPAGRIRVDANGAWSVAEAAEALGRLAAYRLEYAEQPCPTVEALRELRIDLARRGIDVPIAADESIRRAVDPLRVAREEAADLVVVKVAPLGGVRAAMAIVQECGLPAVVSSALDSSVGLAAGLALAAALPTLDHACGLGTAALLAGDVVAEPLLPREGSLQPGRVSVEPAALERWAAPPGRVRWWRERLAAAHAVLAEGERGRLP